MSRTTKCQWVYWSCPMDQQFQISDLVHGSIDVFYPINLIIDTPEFQRLRRLTQLGVSNLVYPSADHSRFSHSLGVYHLARLMVARLARILPELITPNDQLCVCIAALIHDLGHGPFSHTFESKFLKQMGVTDFEHEEMSRKVFKFMLAKNNGWLKEKLDEYLDKIDYEFIDELINPPKDLLSSDHWPLRGRPREKSLLYQIVSEPITGLDVDKVDYLLRDSLLTDVSISFSSSEWLRMLGTTRVTVDSKGFRRICHPNKIKLGRIFESRKLLHESVYGHKTTIAAEIMLVRALVLADPYLEFVGQNGKKYKMSDAHKDPQAFCRLDNNVISLIRFLDDSRLDSAKELIDAIDLRRLPKCLKIMHLNVTGTNGDGTQQRIEADLAQYSNGVEIIVQVRSFDHGKGVHRSPLKALFLFENKNPNNILTNKAVDPTSPTLGGTLVAFFYIDYKDIDKKELAINALQKFTKKHPNHFCMDEGTKRLEPPNDDEHDWHFISPPRKQLREENGIEF